MKRFIFFATLVVSVVSCQHDGSLSPGNSMVTFSFTSLARNNGRVKEMPKAEFVVLSMKSQDGREQNNVKLQLHAFGQSFVSESLSLQTGSYQLTQFLVLDSLESVIYAAPVAG